MKRLARGLAAGLLAVVASMPVLGAPTSQPTSQPVSQPASPAVREDPPSTLAELYASALKSPAVGQAVAGRDAMSAGVRDAYLGFAPRVNWVFDNSRERLQIYRSSNPLYTVGISNFNNHSNTFEVVQPLVDGRIIGQLRVAWASLRRTNQELASTRQRITFELIQAYLVTLGSFDGYDVALAELAALGRHHDELDLRVARGLSSQSDLDEVTARLMAARANALNAAAVLDESFTTLERRAGHGVAALYPLARRIVMPMPDPSTAADWVQEARRQNPDVLSAVYATDEAWAVVETQAGAMLPRLEFRFTQSKIDSGGSVYGPGSLNSDRSGLFRLSIPLFNGDGQGYPVLAARQRWRASQYHAEDQRQDIEERVKTGFTEVVSNAARATQLVRAVDAQSRVVESRRQRFTSGLARITDVLDAERDLFQFRRQELGSRYNYLLNMVSLKRLAGTISEDDVTFITAELDQKNRLVRRVDVQALEKAAAR